MRDGHNLVLDTLKASKQRTPFLRIRATSTERCFFPYRPIEQAARMTAKNHDPDQGTPLYDQAVVLLRFRFSQRRKDFERNGVVARSITLLITDGSDQRTQPGNSEGRRRARARSRTRRVTSSPRWASMMGQPTSGKCFEKWGSPTAGF